MDKDSISWIINQLDEERLQGVCKILNIKIPGFRSVKKYPKTMMIPNLLRNGNEVLNYLKTFSDKSDEKREFQDKDIEQIEALIDINNKEKTIEQIIYLVTRDSLEYKNLGEKIIELTKLKNNTKNEITFDDKINETVDPSSKGVIVETMNISGIDNDNLASNYDQNTNKIKDNKDDSMMKDEKAINKFIVTVEQKNNFYNIYPLYKIDDSKLIKVDRSDYPDYGNINVSPWSGFDSKRFDIKSSLWICRFNEEDLEESGNKTKFKIDGNKLISNNDIYDINSEGIYEIAELFKDNVSLEELIYNEDIEIKNQPIKDKIYIKDSKFIYGPFECAPNIRRGGYFINKKSADYIVDKYSLEDNEKCISIIEIENPYDYSNSYVKAIYFHNKQNLIKESIDTISDEKLLDKLKVLITTKNTEYSKEEVEKARKNIISIVNNCFPEERKQRIKDFIINTEKTERFIDNYLIELINLLLDDKEARKKISDKILEQNDILRKLQNVEIVQAKIENYNEEIEKAKQKLEQIRLEIEDTSSKNEEKVMEKKRLEIEELEDKKGKIEKSIDELTQKYELINDIDKLIIQKEKIILQKEKIEDEAKQAQRDYDTFSRSKEAIQREISKKLDNVASISNYSDVAFDGIIANEILESAAKWSKKRYIESFENQIASKKNVEKVLNVKTFNNENIIDYIYDKFKNFRNYSKNDVINMMICINQGFLTVFAGEPGVGKTSACNIIANILGLSNNDANYNRFTEISVENGWTSKRDLIGYYNPLTKSFDKNNGLLFRTFNILHQEYKKEINDFPYYILLDEANLSSMEHYWADFMNVCDLDKKNRCINLGDDYIYNIPKTLRFLATINYDHTTEALSPRLLDRGWIILLESNDYNSKLINDSEYELNLESIVMFQDLEEMFSFSSYLEEEVDFSNKMDEELRGIYEKFNKNNISISPRIDNMIKKYLKVGCVLFKETESTSSPEFVALDYAIAQKLLPKINGYGEDYKNFLKDLEENFDKNNMVKCKNIISNIINKGDTNMQYYQFFS